MADSAAVRSQAPNVGAYAPPSDTRKVGRIASLDIVRGVVMVLMAIDHVRVYSGLPAGGPTAGIFFTRWITHFCAPAFAFLAGTSAYLHGRKLGDRAALARFLVGRGLLLVLLEPTLIRFCWTFSLDYSQFVLAGVIWMLGWCMVMLAALIWLPVRAIGALGLVVIVAQNALLLLGRLPEVWQETLGWSFRFLYLGGQVKLGEQGPAVSVLYVLVPWIGVMAAGYAFGAVVACDGERRERTARRIGLAATGLFLVIGTVLALRAPGGDEGGGERPFVFRLLDQNKYPASQLYLAMTLGPTLALLPLAERARGRAAEVLATFGRVPMFYYLLHIPLIHVSAIAVHTLLGAFEPAWFARAPFVGVPPEHRWGLPLLYLVFAVDVALLYLPCRWFAALKARHPRNWLRFV